MAAILLWPLKRRIRVEVSSPMATDSENAIKIKMCSKHNYGWCETEKVWGWKNSWMLCSVSNSSTAMWCCVAALHSFTAIKPGVMCCIAALSCCCATSSPIVGVCCCAAGFSVYVVLYCCAVINNPSGIRVAVLPSCAVTMLLCCHMVLHSCAVISQCCCAATWCCIAVLSSVSVAVLPHGAV